MYHRWALTLSVRALYHCADRRASQFPGGILSRLQIKIIFNESQILLHSGHKSCFIQVMTQMKRVRKPIPYFMIRHVTTQENLLCRLSSLGILSVNGSADLMMPFGFRVTWVCASSQICKTSCHSRPGESCLTLTKLTFLRGLFYTWSLSRSVNLSVFSALWVLVCPLLVLFILKNWSD